MSEDVSFDLIDDDDVQGKDEGGVRNRGRGVGSAANSPPDADVEDLTQKYGLTGDFAKLLAAQKEIADSTFRQELNQIKKAIIVQIPSSCTRSSRRSRSTGSN